MNQNKVCIVGIAGGSGSGKTTFASKLLAGLESRSCAIIAQDHYYKDQSKRFDFDGGSVNFDHPSALDFDLMARHLRSLKKGTSVESPRYCFETHTRKKETFTVQPAKVVIVDGILLLSQDDIYAELDHRIYIDCEEELRFQRRLHRDTTERGRTEEGVRNQFFKQVKPMHDLYVEPSKRRACDVVGIKDFEIKLNFWTKKLKETIKAN